MNSLVGIFAVCSSQDKVLPNKNPSTWVLSIILEWCHVGSGMRLWDFTIHDATLRTPLHDERRYIKTLITKCKILNSQINIKILYSKLFCSHKKRFKTQLQFIVISILPVGESSWRRSIMQYAWIMVVRYKSMLDSLACSASSRPPFVVSLPPRTTETSWAGVKIVLANLT